MNSAKSRKTAESRRHGTEITKMNATAGAGKKPRVFGAGLIALDLVVGPDSGPSFQAYAGGTCGNVLTALAYLGWDSYPIARLGADAASQVVRTDMERWGVHLDHASCSPSAHTPIIVQQIRRKKDGTPTHSFSWACPKCGKRLPSFQPVTRAAVEVIAPDLRHAGVFFMDRLSRGILELAKLAADAGAYVVYEPSGKAEPRLLKEAISIAHVVKYAQARLENVDAIWSSGSSTLVEIQTMGEDGLRFRHKISGGRSNWATLAPIKAPRLVDTCGAGDWCTAGFLAEASRLQRGNLRGLKPAQLQAALKYGQALAAWNCGFEGARGGMYASTKAAFNSQTAKLLSGSPTTLPTPQRASSESRQPNCPACA